MSEWNWAGNHAYATSIVRRPTSIGELASLIAAAPSVRALGSRHSFSHIVDADVLVDLSAMPGDAAISADRSTVRVPGHWTYAQLGHVLAAEGLALHNLASLPHISIAGAVATGTHGSGDGNGNLATAVIGLELMTATGDVLVLDVTDERHAGAVVSMGALGIVTALVLRVEPAFEVSQHVFEQIDPAALCGSFDEMFAAGYSVSAFTRWVGDIEQIWVKRRVDRDRPLDAVFAALSPAVVQRHPILEENADGCTGQLGVAGPWHERLPHFRTGFVPSTGEEIQSEFFVPRVESTAAVEALQGIGPLLADVLLVSEIRTIAADDLWMSPHHERDSVGFHFTWRREANAVARAVAAVENALGPHAPRPHWGKVFTYDDFDTRRQYRRVDEFVALQRDLDPSGKFLNPWTRQLLPG